MEHFNNFFHVCIRRKDRLTICYSDSDYDSLVKSIAISSVNCNINIVAYCIMPNHIHILSRCKDQLDLKEYIRTVLHRFSRTTIKNKDKHFRNNIQLSIKQIFSENYFKNTLVYIINNPKDVSNMDIISYRWSSARSIFASEHYSNIYIPISQLSYRDKRRIFNSGIEYIKDKKKIEHWFINSREELEPASFCDWKTAEAALGSKEMLITLINSINMEYIWTHNVEYLTRKLTDYELYNEINRMSQAKYKKDYEQLDLFLKKKIAIATQSNYKCSKAQLSRICRIALDT